jgi:hypothetical protein
VTTLLLLLLAIALAPLALGLVLLQPSPQGGGPRVSAGSVLLCALAFNLTFFWQELWLVIPKALTPGLHPILYHNDHDWTGKAPIAELLQGSGALATLASGLAFCAALALVTRASATWRLFLFWMAFQGLFQSLTQVAIGTLTPGNDVGRALAYLHVGKAASVALLALAVAAMGLAGIWLARAFPVAVGGEMTERSRAFAFAVLGPALASILLIVPFRLPRNLIEVGLIPLIVNLVGAGWLVLGAAITRRAGRQPVGRERPAMLGPALALCAALLVFQLVLRRGIAF